MTQANYTDITFVLDRSGSMASRRQETIDGFNTFIEEQKKVDGRATVSLVQFDNEFEDTERYDAMAFQGMDLHNVPRLMPNKFVPRGATALRDAIGLTVDNVGRRLSSMAEHERPSKVLIVIMSDGMENASKTYSQGRLRGMVTHQQDAYSWNFVFIGTNQDSVLTAGSYGINAGNAMNYDAERGGTTSAFLGMSKSVGAYRASGQTRSRSIADMAVDLGDEQLKCANHGKMREDAEWAPVDQTTTQQS